MNSDMISDMNEPKVSVIVPVYNNEELLGKCVDSLVRQTLDSIEIILVADGSTDSSGRICDEYASRDGRVRVIHTPNGGLSCARNRGIEAARANYIMFADSDDWVEPSFCEVPYGTAVDWGADLVLFGNNVYDNGKKAEGSASRPEGAVSRQDAQEMIFDADVSSHAWNKLYARHLFDDVRYPEGRCYEDVGTTYKLVERAGTIRFINARLYNYNYRRPGSITAAARDKDIQDWILLLMQRKADLEEWGYDLSDHIRREALGILIRSGRRPGVTEPAEEAVREIKGFPKAFSRKYKIMLMVYRVSPKAFDLICVLFGARAKA